jgi:hypothetical protein
MFADNYILSLKNKYNSETRSIVDVNNQTELNLRQQLKSNFSNLKSQYGLDPNTTYTRLSTFQGLKDYYGDIPNITSIADEYRAKRQQFAINHKNALASIKAEQDIITSKMNEETLAKINSYKSQVQQQLNNINNTRKSVKGSIQAQMTKFKQAKNSVRDVIDSLKSEYTPVIGGCCCCDICCCATNKCCNCICYARCCNGHGTDLNACCGNNGYDPSGAEGCCGTQVYDPETVDCCNGTQGAIPYIYNYTTPPKRWASIQLENVVLSGWGGSSSCGPAYQYCFASAAYYTGSASAGQYRYAPPTSTYKKVKLYPSSDIPTTSSYNSTSYVYRSVTGSNKTYLL